MAAYLFVFLLIATSADVAAIALVASFIEQRFAISKFLLQFALCTLIVGALACGGMLLGNFGSQFFDTQMNIWLSASLMLVMSLKAAYDGFKLAPTKRSVNTVFIGGLATVATFAGINAFIYSLALGFLQLQPLPLVLLAAPLFFVVLLVAGLVGTRQKRIPRIQSEWILSAVSLFCALLIIYNR